MRRRLFAVAMLLLCALALQLALSHREAPPTARPGTAAATDRTPLEAAHADRPGDAPAAGDRPDTRAPVAPSGQGLSGRIVDDASRPVGGAHVFAFARPQLDPISAAAAARRGLRTGPLATTDSEPDGTFTLALGNDAVDRRLELHVLAVSAPDLCRKGLAVAAGEWRRLGDLPLGTPMTLRGTVRDADDERPLADALVAVQLPAQDNLLLPGRADGRTSRTDTDGNYAIADLPAGTFRLEALAAGHARIELIQQQLFAGEENVLDLALPAGGVLAGSVVDAQGRGIADALVAGEPLADATATAFARTGADGAFVLLGVAPGPLRVRAAAAGHSEASLDVPAERAGAVRLVLAERGGVRVHVRSLLGLPIDRCLLTARGIAQAGGEPGAALRRVGPIRVGTGRIDGEQWLGDAAVLRDVAAGDWVVEVEAPGHAKATSEPCTVQDGSLTDVTVELRAGGAIHGTVTDARGQPLALAAVTTRPPGLPGGDVGAAFAPLLAQRTSVASVHTGRDGGFTLDQLAPGSYWLHVAHPQFAAARVEATAAEGSTTEVGRIALAAGARLGGHALVDGSVDRTVVVQVLALGDHPNGQGFALEVPVDAQGAFAVEEPLPHGRYALLAGRRRADNPFGENADREQSRVEVDLADGERRTVDLAIRPDK